MPRPKPKKASPVFMTRAHPLKLDQKRELLRRMAWPDSVINAGETPGYEVIGRKPNGPTLLRRLSDERAPNPNPWDAILEVEAVLGFGVDGAQHVDQMPRPADYKSEFTQARRATSKLREILSGWNGFYREKFSEFGQDIQAIERSLDDVLTVCDAVDAQMAGKSSKGAREQKALVEVIKRLRQIFAQWYCGADDQQKTRGAFKLRSRSEVAEHEFIRLALRSARLIPGSYSGLPRLLRDLRSAAAGSVSDKKPRPRSRSCVGRK